MSRSTLYRKRRQLKRKQSVSNRQPPKPSKLRLFSDEQEKSFVGTLASLALTRELTSLDIRREAFQYAETLKLDDKIKAWRDYAASSDWFKRFKERHPEIKNFIMGETPKVIHVEAEVSAPGEKNTAEAEASPSGENNIAEAEASPSGENNVAEAEASLSCENDTAEAEASPMGIIPPRNDGNVDLPEEALPGTSGAGTGGSMETPNDESEDEVMIVHAEKKERKTGQQAITSYFTPSAVQPRHVNPPHDKPKKYRQRKLTETNSNIAAKKPKKNKKSKKK